jgi:hypothetical protein
MAPRLVLQVQAKLTGRASVYLGLVAAQLRKPRENAVDNAIAADPQVNLNSDKIIRGETADTEAALLLSTSAVATPWPTWKCVPFCTEALFPCG